jgi:hypothetical protein
MPTLNSKPRPPLRIGSVSHDDEDESALTKFPEDVPRLPEVRKCAQDPRDQTTDAVPLRR